MNLDATLYNFASTSVEHSWREWERGEIRRSWGCALCARMAYLADVIVNIVEFPLAIIAVTLGSILALASWNYNLPAFQVTKNFIITKTNHVLISAFGATVSPALAHRYRDTNLAPLVIAARITVISVGFFYYFFR